MSKVRLTGSTSGYTEITAPAVAGNNTLLLPASGAGSLIASSDTGSVATAMLANSAITVEKLAAAVAQSLVPPGTVQFHAASTAPSGWIKANGAAVSRTTYAGLFAAIGTGFGAGDGSTTFNVPDLRGEFPRGWDDSRGADSGRAFGTAQAQNTEEHKHRLPNGYDSGNFYGWYDGLTQPAFGSEIVTGTSRMGIAVTISAGSVRLAYSDFMRDRSGETRPRNIALLAIIKF